MSKFHCIPSGKYAYTMDIYIYIYIYIYIMFILLTMVCFYFSISSVTSNFGIRFMDQMFEIKAFGLI